MNFRVSMILFRIITAGFILISSAVFANDDKPTIYYFYSNECPECRQIRENVLPKIIKKYDNQISFVLLELKGSDNLRRLLELEKKMGKKIRKRPPLVIAGNTVLEGDTAVREGIVPLAEMILVPIRSPAVTKYPLVVTSQNNGDEVVRSFRSLGILQIVLGGLLDGINPCAFTTIIFLLSYLTLVGKRGRALAAAGAAFTLGVFVSYFLIGIGLFEIVLRLQYFTALSKVVAVIIGITAFVLSALSVYDYFKLKQGRTKEVILQLGDIWKKRIHAAIRVNARSGKTLFASILLGVFVGIFEFPCTGQVYFPIVVVIRELSVFRMQGILYLLLYNIMFILPLVAVFILAYRGVTSEKMAVIVKKHMPSVKIAMAVFFALLGMFILYQNIL
jgi:cytochrome c biogenesis protein CcdA